MAGDTVLTVIGNLVADVELTFTPSGTAVANFTVASTPRVFDRNTNQWKDSEALFLRCSVWREAAENAAESLFMWISRLKYTTYQAFSGVDMSISSERDAVAVPI